MNPGKIKKTYAGRTVLELDGFDFRPGIIYAVIGGNGSGKSTLAKLLAGVMPADGGPVQFKDAAITYLPQRVYAFRMSVKRNVLLASPGKDIEEARRLMKRLNMDPLMNSAAHRLSGGETARVALIRALMTRCDMMILDEPCAAMDIESTLAAEELIREYRSAHGAAVILITHSVKQAARTADEVLFLSGGRLTEHGAAPDILSNPRTDELRRFLDFFGV